MSSSSSSDAEDGGFVEQRIYRLDRERQRRDEKGDSKPEARNMPAVMWKAQIYDARETVPFNLRTAKAIVQDDRPIDLTSSLTEEDFLSENPERSWEGCVFEVVAPALAYFPENSLKSGRVQKSTPIDSLKIHRKAQQYIVIYSPYLLSKILEMVGYYPAANRLRNAKFGTDTRFFEPYAVFMHHFEQITTLSNDFSSETSNGKEKDGLLRLQIEHLRHLEKFMRPLYADKILPCQKRLEGLSPQISFDMLWYLYKPGTDVYVQGNGFVHTCVIREVFSSLDNLRGENAQFVEQEPKYWTLEMWLLQTDGVQIGRLSTVGDVNYYSGFREVTKLSICPVAIWDAFDKGERRQSMIDRSKLHLKGLQQGHLFAHYNGPVDRGSRRYTGSVIVDHKRGYLQKQIPPPPLNLHEDFSTIFNEYNGILIKKDDSNGDGWFEHNEEVMFPAPAPPSSTAAVWGSGPPSPALLAPHPPESILKSNERSEKSSLREYTKELTDHQLLLLFPLTFAFALKTKQWIGINTGHIREISPSEESLSRLVIGEDEMKAIRAVSQRQNNRHDLWAADFVEGKGTGQIVLLHGPPGTGKTYTVEAIAEWLHRPLLALTVADIGTIETRVEQELLKWFSLAEAWNAVLLVDEADIFLEKRQNRDLARNGLVSAFLRRMEYFKGLLFLTTNRVGQIDDAFISRVHVAFGYKPLGGGEKAQIWNGFFQKLANERAGKLQVAPGAKKWVLDQAASNKAQLNGRDIRNALQTAITLAEAEAEEDPDFDSSKMTVVVDRSHFERVLDISYKFHEYVKSIRREDEKKRAAGRFDRNDYWQEEGDQQ